MKRPEREPFNLVADSNSEKREEQENLNGKETREENFPY